MSRKHTEKNVKKEPKKVDYFIDDAMHKIDLELSNEICASAIYNVKKSYIRLREVEVEKTIKDKEKNVVIERLQNQINDKLSFIDSSSYKTLTSVDGKIAISELKRWRKLVDGLFNRVPIKKWGKFVDLGTNDDVEKFLKNIL